MKELSIEQKAQRYDEVLNRAKKELDVCGSQDCDAVKQIFRFFPELKENKEPDDERVRKGLIELVKQSSEILEKKNQEQMIDWLEKQGVHANFRNKIQIGDKVTRNEDGVLVNLSQLNRVAKVEEKQGEQNPFKCNKEWYDFVRWFVKERTDNYTLIPSNTDIHTWGDIILDHAKKELEKQGEQNPTDKVEPKFHEDDWMKAIVDAGYMWDAEKKELKKIEEEYNGEDYGIDDLYAAIDILQKTLGKVNGYQTDDGILEHKCAISAVKKLYEQKPTDEEIKELLRTEYEKGRADAIAEMQKSWSEEDIDNIKNIIILCNHSIEGIECTWIPSQAAKIKKLMESILYSSKPHSQWKPSDEQIEILDMVLSNETMDDNIARILRELREQLKQLKNRDYKSNKKAQKGE